MQLTYTAVILGSLASLASANVKRELPFPDSVPLHKRQPSGAEYECHADCGYTILNADEEGYCDSDEWKQLLADCLKCANQYDMWGDYGNGVTGAAKACGIDAVPEGASSGSATGSSAAATTTVVTSVTSAAATSDAATSAEESSAEETTAAAETTSAAAASSTAAEETAATTAETSADANTTPGAAPTTTENDNSASNFALSGVLAIGAALIAAAGLL
ncbi:hypothetical protein BHE90_001715 [Fusarium euwallaceae]|uniref:Extracellular membrane protein CFEM domain-containing protein n=2 Tax=Fusarium solani species complex TaxID=232080 RepID=A0A3M2SQT8_9HYPO|nr:hypothetical protein CDV36_000701 [Fusarium kuroshium]RTE83762.1 hypothetical protein BHE90_001715 [Fusarium euwallaceae]